MDFERIVKQKYQDIQYEGINASPEELELNNLITAMACHFDIAESRLNVRKIFKIWMRSIHSNPHDRFVVNHFI